MQQGIIASYEAGRGTIQTESGQNFTFTLGYIRTVFLSSAGKRKVSGALRTDGRNPKVNDQVLFEENPTSPPQVQFVVFADEWQKLTESPT